MRKVTVNLNAVACTSVELEIDEELSDDEIIELAYEKAKLEDCEPSCWDTGSEEISDSDE